MARILKLLVFTFLVVTSTLYVSKFFLGKSNRLECEDCNVVVMLVDTLRADRLPAYGHVRDTAPFLTGLMEQSLIFDRAFSSSSWTAPATASVFTSLLPSEHGIITGFVATKAMMKRGSSISMNRIPDNYEVLGETMKKAGYNTIAVTDNLNIGNEMGFDRGFDHFKKLKEKGAARVNKTADEFIKQVEGKGKYFLYLHYMDPHAPYIQHKPWYDECLKTTDQSLRESMMCAYDSEIRYLDGKIKEMFIKHNWSENTIVILLSDHGEEFWEHGDKGHARTLYTEVIHVPFFIYHPNLPAMRIGTNVHTMDLLPTMAGMLGIKKNEQWKGKNLIRRIRNFSLQKDRLIFSERLRTPHSASKWWRRSVIQNKDHYILTQEPEKDDIDELYDLEFDFAEQFNLATKRQKRTNEMSSYISLLPDANSVQNKSDVEVEMNKELYEKLKTLGYIG